MSGDIGIGRLIDGQRERDAIHVAVAPVTATERLYPGQALAFTGDDRKSVKAGEPGRVGIVDPFLRGPVYPGQSFWMFLSPGSITSLRHDVTGETVAESKRGSFFTCSC